MSKQLTITPKEVEQLIRVERHTIYRWRKEGKFPHFIEGTHIYDRDQVMRAYKAIVKKGKRRGPYKK